MNNIKSNLHYDVEFVFNNNGKSINEILKKHFLLYMKMNTEKSMRL